MRATAASITSQTRRSIANAIQVFFKDGSSTEQVAVEYPVGHRRRREEGIPLLIEKFRRNCATRFGQGKVEEIMQTFADSERLVSLPVPDLVDLLVI